MENQTINQKQDEIIEEFSMFEEWMDKYEYIIDLGKHLPLISAEYKIDNNLINGCQSKVWVHAEYKEGKIFFTADSDAIITKGIIGLLIRTLSGHTPEEIVNTDLYFIDKTGLSEHLSPTRSNGLTAMVKQLKMYAMVFKMKNS